MRTLPIKTTDGLWDIGRALNTAIMICWKCTLKAIKPKGIVAKENYLLKLGSKHKARVSLLTIDCKM